MRTAEMAHGDGRYSSTPSWSRERPHSRGQERTRAKDAAAVQNLRKLAKLIPLPAPVFATRRRGSVVPSDKCRRRQSPPGGPSFPTSGNGWSSAEAGRIGLFPGLDTSMNQTLTALEIELFYE
jgi:hypothetical protein